MKSRSNLSISKLWLAVPLLAIVCSLFPTGQNDISMAADTRLFNAANIMSDYVMTNKTSMTEAQIQSFLKSKNYCNDTDYSKYQYYSSLGYTYTWRDGHFVCMADENFNGESAARIIWQVAQEYNINPQVLIVLLQKEQGLITDTWPNSTQYRSATGYGCPDTAPCDAEYFGFKNQVRNAARFFRAYQDNNPGWYKPYWTGTNTIKWHPNNSCGTSTVNIENRATASLYSFTPYRPNQAALNAGYGTGDSCSSYGNRNFWNYFTDWFGNTNATQIKWVEMSIPRIMTVETATYKIYPDNKELDVNLLQPDQKIIFSSKTTVNWGEEDTTCLRTKIDTQNKINRCVLMPRLKELAVLPPALIMEDHKKTTMQYTCKVNLNIIEAVCTESELARGRTVEMAATVDIMGMEYYITKHDWDKGIKDRGLRKDRFTTSPTFIEFMSPRSLVTTKKTASKNIVTNQVCAEVAPNTSLLFATKTFWENTTYYRTKTMTDANSFCVLPASDLREK